MAKYPNFGYRGMPVIPIAWVAVCVVLIIGQFSFGTAFILGIILTIVFFASDDAKTTNIVSIPLGLIALIIALIVGN